MLRLMFVLLVLFGFQSGALADSHVVKVLDGAAAHCDSERERALKNQKVVMVSLLGDNSLKNHMEITLQVSLVKCVGSKWVVDRHPGNEVYSAPEGDTVEVTFSQFKLLMVNKNYEILEGTTLDHLQRQGQQVVTLSVPKVQGQSQEVEILIHALKQVSSDSGLEYSETINFGSFRFHPHHGTTK